MFIVFLRILCRQLCTQCKYTNYQFTITIYTFYCCVLSTFYDVNPQVSTYLSFPMTLWLWGGGFTFILGEEGGETFSPPNEKVREAGPLSASLLLLTLVGEAGSRSVLSLLTEPPVSRLGGSGGPVPSRGRGVPSRTSLMKGIKI